MLSRSTQARLAVALVSMAILLFEILVTRLLSVTLSYHFAFLAISLAMLGLAAPAVWISLRPPGPRALSAALLVGGLSLPISILAIIHLGAPLRATPAVWVLFLLGPMISLGTAVCLLLLGAEGGRVSGMYAADLVGAALGAVLTVPLLSGLPTPMVLASLGFLPLAAGLLLQNPRRIATATAAAAIMASLIWGTPYSLRYTRFYEETVAPLYEKWTPTARITVQRSGGLSGWGMGSRWQGTGAEALWIDQDGSAGTGILRYHPASRPPEQLLYDVTAAQYELGSTGRVCIIGGGGGKDILSARLAGAREVEVVELNPWTVDAVSVAFGEYSGDPYHLPGVHTVVGEGRSHFARSGGEACDILQISQIDTFAASAAGAYALTENSLYTVEAIQSFWKRLSPNGVLSISRWARGPAWPESARLVTLLDEALRRLDIEDPRQHLAIVAAGGTANVMVFRRPVEQKLVTMIDTVAGARGFERWWPPVPGKSLSAPAEVLLNGVAEFERHGYDLSPTTDDRPFFFQTLSLLRGRDKIAQLGTGERERSVTILRDLALTLSGATVLLLFLPFLLAGKLPRRRGHVRRTIFYSSLGFGFLFIEIPLLQRLALYLGHPSYSTTVVLGALLLGAGVGSALVPRIPQAFTRTVALLVPVAVAALTFALAQIVVPATQSFELWPRLAIATAMLLPLGLPMGVLLPLGMSGVEGRERSWAWAVNGASSVLASVLSLIFALLFGFNAVLALAVGFYALAAFSFYPEETPGVG